MTSPTRSRRSSCRRFSCLPHFVDQSRLCSNSVDATERYGAVGGPELFVDAPRRVHAHFVDGVSEGRRECVADALDLGVRDRLAKQQCQHERARAIGRHRVVLHALHGVRLFRVPQHFRTHDVNAPVPLVR